MKKIEVTYVSSTASKTGLVRDASLSDYVVAQEGYCVVVEALESKAIYNQIECIDGEFRTISKGDVFVGVLGERRALKGCSGVVPRAILPGDTLNVLNMGGIIGTCVSDHPDLGPALKVKVLGAAMVEKDGMWVHARLQDHALHEVDSLTKSAQLIFISGTAMNTGKTWAACELVQRLTRKGYRVAAAKATGASLMRDVRLIEGHGAIATATFTDAGVVCSTSKAMAPYVKGLIHHLSETADPDVIVIELGDGIIGYYGVDELLQDKELQKFCVAHIVAAVDLAGVWAAQQLFKDRYHAEITVVTGPVTDNGVGKQYIEQVMGITAINAREDPNALGDRVASKLTAPKKPATSA
ncbi:MAG: hypothetical protein O2797_06460 [Bacteroidetes bacterium]|nr:hypothetical protein [Bacteroidota bacterium]